MIKFERYKDPKEILDIGTISACRSLLEKMDGIILSKDQSEQERKLFHDPDIWKDPKIKTAADFDWLEPWLLNKTAAAAIVIAQFGDEFVINKNVYFPLTRKYKGKIEDLYEVVKYWYEKKRIYRHNRRKKWRTLETGERIYV
jgi:hypothetical protein